MRQLIKYLFHTHAPGPSNPVLNSDCNVYRVLRRFPNCKQFRTKCPDGMEFCNLKRSQENAGRLMSFESLQNVNNAKKQSRRIGSTWSGNTKRRQVRPYLKCMPRRADTRRETPREKEKLSRREGRKCRRTLKWLAYRISPFAVVAKVQ